MGRRHYSLAEAQALLPAARLRVADLTNVVAQLRTLSTQLERGTGSAASAASVAMLQDAVDEELAWFEYHDVRITSLTPTLLDFPARAILDGEALEVYLCWREDEDTIAYYHRLDAGYRGRAPVGLLDRV